MGKFDFPVFIFGAGATIGSGYGLGGDPNKLPPSNEDFFKALNPSWQYKVPALVDVCEALNIEIQRVSLEMLWNWIYMTRKYVQENLISIESRLGDFDQTWGGQYPGDLLANREISFDEMLSRLAEIDLIYIVWHILKRLEIPQGGIDNYKRLFKEAGLISEENEPKKQFAVISFNYDICLEETWSSSGNFFYYYPNFEDNNRKYRIPVLKLHGSLNWKHGRDGNVRPTDGHRIMEEREFEAKRPQLSREARKNFMPMIIPPTYFKEELFFSSGQERVRRHFNELWRRAYQLLCKGSCLIIIGYSFPEADPHARWLLKATGDRPSFIVNKYCDEKDKRRYENIVKSCLNKVDGFCHKGFGECFGEIKKWINK